MDVNAEKYKINSSYKLDSEYDVITNKKLTKKINFTGNLLAD
jgi:hypothetical protein